MRSSRRVLLLLALLGVCALWWWAWRDEGEEVRVRVVEELGAVPTAAPRRAGRIAEVPGAEVVSAARRWMNRGGGEGSCGPYRLVTDVDDERLLSACATIGETLDGVYAARFGVEPVGPPAETILLFADLGAFRSFVLEEGRLRVGYAGLAAAAHGYVALHAEDRTLSSVAETLAHELTHLVHRRALGPGLLPWLSEGLADAIGDGAGLEGLGRLRGLDGVEAQAERLRGAYSGGEAQSLERLVGLTRSEFDRGLRSFDYEQSALFVRFLLLEADLGGRFREYLGRLAAGERYDPETLRQGLGSTWAGLERRFAAWLTARPYSQM